MVFESRPPVLFISQGQEVIVCHIEASRTVRDTLTPHNPEHRLESSLVRSHQGLDDAKLSLTMAGSLQYPSCGNKEQLVWQRIRRPECVLFHGQPAGMLSAAYIPTTACSPGVALMTMDLTLDTGKV